VRIAHSWLMNKIVTLSVTLHLLYMVKHKVLLDKRCPLDTPSHHGAPGCSYNCGVLVLNLLQQDNTTRRMQGIVGLA